MIRQVLISSLLLTAICAHGALSPQQRAQLPAPATHAVDFEKEIKPIFDAACVKCHGKGKEKGGFSLETRDIFFKGGDVHAILRNPYRAEGGSHHAGNKMALGNIRERLKLHFDAEARLESRVRDAAYEVHIRMPYHRAPSKAAREAGLGPHATERPVRARVETNVGTGADRDLDGPALREARSGVSRG